MGIFPLCDFVRGCVHALCPPKFLLFTFFFVVVVIKLRRPQFCRLRTIVWNCLPAELDPSARHFTASVPETTENVPVLE